MSWLAEGFCPTNAALLLDSGVVDMRQQAAGQAPQLAAGAGP